MQLRQYIKLFALFVGAHLIIQSFGVVFTAPRFGYTDSLFAEGMWMFPVIALVIATLLFLYASNMKLEGQTALKGLVVGAIKIYGLFLLVTGVQLIVSGLFSPGLFSPPPTPASEIDNTHQVIRPFLTGGLNVIIALVFIFKTEAVARVLKIRGDV